jgi:hypothetical protein
MMTNPRWSWWLAVLVIPLSTIWLAGWAAIYVTDLIADEQRFGWLMTLRLGAYYIIAMAEYPIIVFVPAALALVWALRRVFGWPRKAKPSKIASKFERD